MNFERRGEVRKALRIGVHSILERFDEYLESTAPGWESMDIKSDQALWPEMIKGWRALAFGETIFIILMHMDDARKSFSRLINDEEDLDKSKYPYVIMYNTGVEKGMVSLEHYTRNEF